MKKLLESILKEGRIVYGGPGKAVPFETTITLKVRGKVMKEKNIDSETKEPIPEDVYSVADVEYDTDDLETQIKEQLKPTLEKAFGQGIQRWGGNVLVGFPNSLGNRTYDEANKEWNKRLEQKGKEK